MHRKGGEVALGAGRRGAAGKGAEGEHDGRQARLPAPAAGWPDNYARSFNALPNPWLQLIEPAVNGTLAKRKKQSFKIGGHGFQLLFHQRYAWLPLTPQEACMRGFA